MPTYEYRCKSCGHELEAVQTFTDEPLTKCPSCKKKQLRKVFGSIGITFKGSGFYKTDSRSGSSATTAPKESGDAAAASSGDSSDSASSGTDTKTEKKADTVGKPPVKKDSKKPSTPAA